jgi:RNA polymerase sigma-70 factor (ECF subfamily)
MSERQTDPATIRDQLEALHSESFAWATVCCSPDMGEAEDVLQMTYLKILDGRARFEGRSAFKTWLFGVIRMTAREQRRRAWWSWSRRAPVETVTEYPSPEDTPDHAATKREQIEEVRTASLRLPQRQHQVLMLVFYHDITLDEAAAIMGVSPGSARKHYQRGKEQLRLWLGQLHPAS